MATALADKEKVKPKKWISRDSIRRIRKGQQADETVLIRFFALVGIEAREGEHYTERVKTTESSHADANSIASPSVSVLDSPSTTFVNAQEWGSTTIVQIGLPNPKSEGESAQRPKWYWFVSLTSLASVCLIIALMIRGRRPSADVKPPEVLLSQLVDEAPGKRPAIEMVVRTCGLFASEFQTSDIDAVSGLQSGSHLKRLESAGFLRTTGPTGWTLTPKARVFAQSRLNASKDAPALTRRFDNRYVELLRGWSQGLDTGKAADLRSKMGPRQADWESVCQHLISRAKSGDTSEARQAARDFHDIRFALQNYEWFANWNPQPIYVRGSLIFANAKAWAAAGDCESGLAMLDFRAGHLQDALAGYRRAKDYYERCHYIWGVIDALRTIADLDIHLQNHDEAKRFLLAGLSQCRPNDHWLRAECLRTLATYYQAKKNWPLAIRQYEAALPIFRSIGARGDVATCQEGLGEANCAEGRYRIARSQTLAALEIFHRNGDLNGSIGSSLQMAWIDIALAKHDAYSSRKKWVAEGRRFVAQARKENLEFKSRASSRVCEEAELALDKLDSPKD